MILSLQGCFARDDLYAKVTHFLSLIFPEDSGALFVGTAPDKLEPVAVWGPSPPKKAFATHNCLALWKWQVHCGTACDQSFRCPQKNPDSHVHICVPFDKQPEVVGLLQILSGPREHKITSKKRHASIVAEHIGLILVSMRMNEDLLNQTLRDPLTGLFNRRFLEEALKVEISRAVRHHKFLGIVMIDLDHFKQFNDTYGHPAGDVLLKEIGFLLQRNVRSSDIACRYGGEEFTLVLAEASRENVLHRTEEIRVKARKLRVWYLYQWLSGLSLSAGVAIYPEHGNTPEALLIAADRALYRAKETGRDRVCLAGEDQGWGTASGRGT
jgi:diguanylate cyclase (GGDEF)-like protein